MDRPSGEANNLLMSLFWGVQEPAAGGNALLGGLLGLTSGA
jgi:hypothetical protein